MSAINKETVSTQLHTVGDYLRFGASQFNKAELFFGHGTDNAWDEATTLTMFALQLPHNLTAEILSCRLIEEEKFDLLSLFERRVTEAIPVAYIINQATFANLPFYVDERVLVPRSPIGELIENRFQSIIESEKPPKRILDLCTGSG